MNLKTKRLSIRPFTMNDAADAHAFFTLTEVMQPVGMAPAFTAMEQTKSRLAHWETDGLHHAIALHDTGEVIGYIAVNPDSEEGRGDTRELGFALHPAYQHKGYMDEAVSATLDELRRTGVRFVWACCFQENLPSKRFIERTGFVLQQEGEFAAQGAGKTYPSFEYRMELSKEGRMQIGDIISFDKYQWRVLDVQNNAALIITEEMVAQRPYHNRPGDVTWADCELRQYLNGAFYDTFSEVNRSRIMAVTNKNPDNPWYAAKGGGDTQDHLFLLSIDEAVCKYFGDSSRNLENRSAKQRYWFQKKDENNQKRKSTFDGFIWWWWLRSPGRDNRRAVYIHGDGNLGIQGNGTFHYSSNGLHPLTGDNSGGVRPALWLKLSSDNDL